MEEREPHVMKIEPLLESSISTNPSGRKCSSYSMALVSADSRIAELLTELHQLIKQTQEERSRSEHNLVNIQKTHERMQTENKISPYYRTKLRGLYTTAKADAEAECNILRKALDKIAEIKSLLEERRIAAKIAGLYNDSEPPRKTMRRGVLMTLLQQSAMTLPLWIGKPGDKPPPLCGAIPASGDYVAKPGDKVAARVKAMDGDEQWILAEVVSYSHATNKYEVDDIDEEGKERHTLSRRRVIPLPQWKANPETDPEALFQKEQLVLALYPQTTCFYRALIHTPPQRPQDDYSVLFEDTSYADGYSPPLNVAQSILRKALDKIAEIKSLLEERRIAAKIAGLYNDSEPPRKTMRRGVLMTLLQQSAMTLPLWIGKPGDKPPPLCGAIPASGDYVAKPGDKVAARVKAMDGDEQWILAEVVSYSHATNKYEVDDIDEEGKERHTLSRRRVIPLPQWKANPETDPEALFQKEQLVLALYPQTTCFYRALIHTPPQRPQDDYSVLFEDTSYADGYSPPLNVAQRMLMEHGDRWNGWCSLQGMQMVICLGVLLGTFCSEQY
ncbi:SAGA-associated factor 29 isoform X1 [Tenrec ecaudatus]|uniref:SAGA-associated factor 29 isoform X1 n=2 Tax=Tenrec ecaudatus TaxID=94439 RepID=UPI003F5AD900